MYQNYIFDLYGTLVDIHTNEEKAYLHEKMAGIYSAMGAAYSKREWKEAYKQSCKKKKEAGKAPYCEIEIREVFKELFLKKGIHPEKGQIEVICQTFRVLSRSYLRLYEGVEEFFALCRQKGKHVYLLSNAQTAFTLGELKELDLYYKFEGIVISSEVKVCKPDKRIMEALFKKYHLKKEESIMIGNDRTSDIMVAKNSGVDSLYIHSNISPKSYTLEEERIQADYEILDGDFRKIKGLILK
ncbi:MAG: HAD family hydrolase [Lachnospiraceae bacterium]|nr:HAD family hydrolase [Lachnospiraceae bacterium]